MGKLIKGVVVKSTGSWYHVRKEDHTIVSARLRGKFKNHDLKVTNPIAVGDLVLLKQEDSSDSYTIEDIELRQNYIVRRSTRKSAFGHLLGSNIDQAILIFTLSHPRTSLGFVDRFLISCESFRIPALLIINKTDLFSEEDLESAKAFKEIYCQAGYRVILSSALNGEGADEIKNELENKTSLIAGHSGVGKSSFLNMLCPGAGLKTSGISNFSNKGVHTTTFAEMHSIDDHTHLIDTPGVKEWGLYEISKEEISHYYPEMRVLIGQCKFHNCKHYNEPGCIIIEKVKEGVIPLSRYQNYLNILMEEEDHK
ncbi:MAG TPA: ribosome small subunit-dependent GTPase A [Cytophagaceae bacterium]|jgi:ribosome biogenesis GTPase|nr:ribosome small subunit-dependent GTPase A [Cytophagaceae bacterium]